MIKYIRTINNNLKNIIDKGLSMVDKLWPITQNIIFDTIKSTRLNGRCERVDRHNYIISINPAISKEEDILEVVVHELLHSYPNVFNDGHTGEWKKRADIVNNKYGLNVKRTNTFERNNESNTYKYIIQCMECNIMSRYSRKPRCVDHLEDYRCCKCKKPNTLKLIKSPSVKCL